MYSIFFSGRLMCLHLQISEICVKKHNGKSKFNTVFYLLLCWRIYLNSYGKTLVSPPLILQAEHWLQSRTTGIVALINIETRDKNCVYYLVINLIVLS